MENLPLGVISFKEELGDKVIVLDISTLRNKDENFYTIGKGELRELEKQDFAKKMRDLH